MSFGIRSCQKSGELRAASLNDRNINNDETRRQQLDSYTMYFQLLANMAASSSSDFVDYRRSRITTNTHDTDYYEGTYSQTTDAGTSHLSVLDANGDAVAVTSTINT